MHAGATWPQVLLRELQDPVTLMNPDTGKGNALTWLLKHLCTVYLLDKRRRFDGLPPNMEVSHVRRVRDPVAHFHFGNGALLQSVHWRCDAFFFPLQLIAEVT